jgi:5-methylcytosine-specific restriction endonuclease McrA
MSSALKASDALERGSRRCLPGCPTVADKERRRYAANRGAGLAHAHAARARNVGASGFTTGEQITARIAYYGGRCYLCGEPATTIDHVIPLARGGSNWPANLRPCCRSCNATKGRRLLAELPDELRPKRAR